VPSLAWKPCAQKAQRSFDCATARVPLDYDRPAGQQIRLAVIRRAATDAANRIGTIFFNPGGPGGAGTEDLPNWSRLFAATLRARFDLVSWDPRGIGASTAVQCFRSDRREARFVERGRRGIPAGARPAAAVDAHQVTVGSSSSRRSAWPVARVSVHRRCALRSSR
jgi:pimeloyl-ACP methyl ester carboxylesterase